MRTSAPIISAIETIPTDQASLDTVLGLILQVDCAADALGNGRVETRPTVQGQATRPVEWCHEGSPSDADGPFLRPTSPAVAPKT
jgi:hypothetical protein